MDALPMYTVGNRAAIPAQTEDFRMTTQAALLLQEDAGSGAAAALIGIGSVVFLFALALGIICLIAMWKVFTKAGQPGWAILIPIYNLYIMMKIAGKPGWWVVLCFIPLVNLIIMLLMAIGIAQAFGRSTAFGVIMLFFLGIIGYLILGFGSSKYVGAAAAAAKA